jgi:hypothetical protein|tara:strand:- start:4330 stop:4584 length:255 start_codon:yes stop_codon:yes gene_type:complete
VLSTIEGSTISVSAQDMSATALGADLNTSVLTDATGATTALSAIDSAIVAVSNSLASLDRGGDAQGPAQGCRSQRFPVAHALSA